MSGKHAGGAWPEKVRGVAARLDHLLSELDQVVGTLSSILDPPADGQAPQVVEVPAP